jgi:hypothetical protein
MVNKRYLQFILAIFTAVSTVAAFQEGIFREKGKPPLAPGKYIFWRDPGHVSKLDFRYGIGGKENQPQPPFQFIDEDFSGSNPKVNVRDSRGVDWNVKWGPEGRSSVFATRLAWACGFYVEPEYFVEEGTIEGAHGLKRAFPRISQKDGSFKHARFQKRSGAPKYMDGYGWKWADNPFVNTPQLQGFKILMLLVSNWDNKDARDYSGGILGHSEMDTNLAIFEDNRNGERRYYFADDDWGGSMGKWGGSLFAWTRWDCKGFASQTPDFLKHEEDGRLHFGYNGKHRKELTADITVSDIQWLMQYLGKISDDQIRTGLEASGAKPEEVQCFSQALRQRIEQLRQVAPGAPEKNEGTPVGRK